MNEILQIMREEITKAGYKVNGELVKTKLEIRSHKRPLRRAHAQEDESNMKSIYGLLQLSFFAEVCPHGQKQSAVKYTRELEGYANEGWQIKPEVVKQGKSN